MIYRGSLITCRTCLFPVRLPYGLRGTLDRSMSERKRSIVLACPACAHVRRYRRADLEAITFRIPDPFHLKKAVLYAVDAACATSRCGNTPRIYAVAATTVSVASLLEVWKHWVIHMHCQGHSFKPLSPRTWWIHSINRPN